MQVSFSMSHNIQHYVHESKFKTVSNPNEVKYEFVFDVRNKWYFNVVPVNNESLYQIHKTAIQSRAPCKRLLSVRHKDILT